MYSFFRTVPLLLLGSTLSYAGVPLIEPKTLVSSNGKLNVEMTMTVGTIQTACHTVTTRLYQVNGETPTSPGTTLRLKKGDALNLTLTNKLEPVESFGEPNTFRAPNVTNFHTHGLHVSPKKGSDDVLTTEINGHESLSATFNIPDYHTPGLYWYHPHFHGSTAMQVGGLAIGALIIDDDKSDGVPVEIKALPEHLLVLGQINIPLMETMAKTNGDKLWKAEPDTKNCTAQQIADDSDAILVNGQSKPTLTIKANEWHRLRILNANVQDWLDIQKPSSCDFQLLAKDGIYLNDAPREVSHAVLAGGNRADIAVRCDSTGTYELESALTKERSSNQFLWRGTLLTLQVEESEDIGSGSGDNPLPKLNYKTPCYLPDLTNTTADFTTSFVMTDDEEKGLFQINGQSFNPSQPTYEMDLESILNFDLGNIDFHTFHIHVSPFQLLENGGSEDDNYFLKGDWHDTIFLPDLPEDKKGHVLVGFQPESYDGDYVMHCHILPHEDQGMMGTVKVKKSKKQSRLCPSKKGGNSYLGLEIGLPTALMITGFLTTVGIGITYCVIKRHRSRGGYQRMLNFDDI
ncbi:multicopper oxidase domain-containing protein [Sansalvadorimonas sp. 2012CJ34-2]|uniref:Multicopper oxidase domain-containing protein n=1 Tax=Parendozoicomonas callyspongiae TaxID=2942213 RepID=A0ABT0PG44_9GAMM|nr:multicopper oxidase domain-containing protein [Sansalvadorimonas sp. 2012CJ34-2]MCL6269737.1 multicopper oxidase domain-containing protein [Sansalvadorimonas sp. 2012CJ34-2]